MAEYIAPTREMKFVLKHVIEMAEISELERFQDASADIVDAVLEEAGKFCGEILSPLNVVGDREGARLTKEGVIPPPGFKEAYASYAENGWTSVSGDIKYGGQGLPITLASAVYEFVDASNMAFSLCSMLTTGAIESILAHGSEEQKNTYLEKMISGQWAGSMNLTESNAGTDVGALRTKAVPYGDGTYRISGQKIFITWGDHDMTENIIHLVLARTPNSPAGTRGISLFIVPKFLINEDGSLGARNDAKCVSLEHKLGIHGSPTCVMAFGEEDNCVGYMLGAENKGMAAMFTMMNNARLNVGIQGVGCAERAWQMAVDYAKERLQGVAVGATKPGPSAIIEHADVRRMLMTIKSTTEAARAITMLNAKALDLGGHHPDRQLREKYAGLADLLTPLSKAYGSDIGVENASLALQIHGGMGFIEETGIAQIYRDGRINPIYEGTNGVQAMDLVGRKLSMMGGSHWRAFLTEMADFAQNLPLGEEFSDMRKKLNLAVETTRDCAEWIVAQHGDNMRSALAGSVPFLRLFSVTAGCYLLAKGAAAARAELNNGNPDTDFLEAKIITSRFYAQQIVPTAVSLKEVIMTGDDLFFAIPSEKMG
ncbi:3-methylmercaptopropionyl-CoA dehydrogenase (DmdC) [hydrothermal vent metagenome]|uniref:3-methylmercaptopropionyl-CoA dehydrogenase (DmdC) n=1 Tax=hydrothermal vent metagenome TaxID=652676 RepID=A0A3B1AU44_9ZZZZ